MVDNLVLFDGVCNLCESSVQFIIRHDSKVRFRFASLQSAYAQQLLKERGLQTKNFDSIVLVQNNQLYQRSDAALRIARLLSHGWSVLYVFIVVPRFIRDAVYDVVAANRYRWFGKKDVCMIPTPDLKSRFIE